MEDLFLLIPELCLDLFLLAWVTSIGARQFGFGWWWSPFFIMTSEDFQSTTKEARLTTAG